MIGGPLAAMMAILTWLTKTVRVDLGWGVPEAWGLVSAVEKAAEAEGEKNCIIVRCGREGTGAVKAARIGSICLMIRVYGDYDLLRRAIALTRKTAKNSCLLFDSFIDSVPGDSLGRPENTKK